MRQIQRCDAGDHALRDLICLLVRAVDQDGDDLFSAMAGDELARSAGERAAHFSRYMPEAFVASLVAVVIVSALASFLPAERDIVANDSSDGKILLPTTRPMGGPGGCQTFASSPKFAALTELAPKIP